MPCTSRRRRSKSTGQMQSEDERLAEVAETTARLEKKLQRGEVTVKVGPTGAITFVGWKPEDREDVTDVCAYRKLASSNSWALRQAVARAEAQAGRKVDVLQVSAGVHSHDGGKTWDPGH